MLIRLLCQTNAERIIQKYDEEDTENVEQCVRGHWERLESRCTDTNMREVGAVSVGGETHEDKASETGSSRHSQCHDGNGYICTSSAAPKKKQSSR